MLLNAFTLFHVVLSLIGIGSGVVVIYGLIKARTLPGWTKLFLATTAATSVYGLSLPVSRLHACPGARRDVVVVASFAMYRQLLLRTWRRTRAITAAIALYFNVFVFVVQLFRRIPAIALAPTQSEPLFRSRSSRPCWFLRRSGFAPRGRTRPNFR
jgi:hypothetical protein